jgi:ABC-type Mn2+/Zn2+ transport system ATPase subunit
MFIEQVMDLVELNPLRDALIGLPGVSGLSTEQRKRLTIAVELVANPSIIFMDEPTSGLDARAAAIVMRTVRNTVDTGRTVVCTIHQPSIDIFEAFDEVIAVDCFFTVISSFLCVSILRFCLDLIDAAVPDEERRGGDIRGPSRTPIS